MVKQVGQAQFFALRPDSAAFRCPRVFPAMLVIMAILFAPFARAAEMPDSTDPARLVAGGVAAAADIPPAGPGAASANAAELGDLDLEQLMELRVEKVTGASKYEQKVTQAPAAITIVTSDEIRKQGYRTLAEILGGMRGLYVSNDRNYSYLGSRGFLRPGDYNSRLLVLVDGHRMNDNVYDGAFIGREAMVDVSMIDRVEFVRGPSSSIYGNNAFFGVINVITRSGRELDGAQIAAEGGSFGSFGQNFSYGKLFANGVDLAVSGANYSSAGQRHLYYPEFDQRSSADPRARNNGVADDSDAEDALGMYVRARYQDWTLAGFAATRDKQVPTASFDTMFNDGREMTQDRRVYLDLKYDHAFGRDLQWLARASYDRYSYYGDYPFDYASPGDPPDIVVNRDESLGEWLGAESQLRFSRARYTLLLGAEFRENLKQNQFNFDVATPDAREVDAQHSSRVAGAFAQADVALAEWLRLNAGLRYDHYFGSFGGALNPRVGLILNPLQQTTFKVLYGQAFRAPNAYERYYFGVQPAAPELQPETIRTYELVAEQYLGRHHRLNLSAYRYTADTLITQTSDDAGNIFFVNRNSAESKGVELEAEGQYGHGFALRSSYALQETTDAQTGVELSFSPRHLAKATAVAPLVADKLFAALDLRYTSPVRTITGARIGGFVLTHLNLSSRNLVPGLELSAGVNNLFDKAHAFPGAEDHLQDAIAQDGRSFRLNASFRF